jgi:hypothetical protein
MVTVLPAGAVEHPGCRQLAGGGVKPVVGEVGLSGNREVPQRDLSLAAAFGAIAGSGRRESNPHCQLGKLMFCH